MLAEKAIKLSGCLLAGCAFLSGSEVRANDGAQTVEERDEAIAQIAAETVFNKVVWDVDASRSKLVSFRPSKVLVIDKDVFRALPEKFRCAMLEVAAEESGGVKVIRLPRGFRSLPDGWPEKGDPDELTRNTKYLLLELTLRGTTREKTLEWSFLCSTVMCGHGGRVTFNWEDGVWQLDAATLRAVRY